MGHWFFLSYAHDNLDNYLRRFYRDLNKTIRDWTEPGEGGDGFFDTRDIEVGKHWPDALVAALQNCRTFISLYSPAYFTKEYCGKEWEFFSSRQAAYSANLPAHASRPTLLMPVLWVPEARLPSPLLDVVSAVQYKHSDFGEVYAREGLRQLMALSKYRDHYREFLAAFATKLIQAARDNNLPPHPHPPPLNEIENAFRRQGAEAVKIAEEPINVGPRFVQFVFVAGRRDELRAVREKFDHYGDEGGCDWHPYLPEVPHEVGIIAQEAASKENLHYGFLQPDDTIIKRLEEAERQNKIVVIMVDTWTLRLPQYQPSMREYDGRNFLNCVLFVSWNNKDNETETNRPTLINTMQKIFWRNAIKRDPNCFLEISSHDELKRELPIALNKARARISAGAKVVKKAEGGQIIGKPLISV